MSLMRPLHIVLGAAIVLLVAALTHLSAVLLLPRVATRDAYDLLAGSGGEINHMRVLPPARPGDRVVPFRDPAVVQGLCYFDLSKGPVRVKTTTEEGRLLTLSFRTREGKIFYSMTDRAALRGTIDIRLVTAAQLADIVAQDDDDEGLPEELRLQSPGLRGLLVATALIARPSERTDAENRVRSITCASEPLPAPS
jgi:uncharacterized membrane protein